jgi:hypothetical protein
MTPDPATGAFDPNAFAANAFDVARQLELVQFFDETYGVPAFAKETYGVPAFAKETYGVPAFANETYEISG